MEFVIEIKCLLKAGSADLYMRGSMIHMQDITALRPSLVPLRLGTTQANGKFLGPI